MRADWQHFLARQGGRIENGRLLDFGEPQAELSALGGGTVITDLSGFGLLACNGEHAASLDGGVHLHSLQGPKLAILPLPYASD